MSDKQDQIYRQNEASTATSKGSFKFDAQVANVFSDMISRSVPGYRQILEMLPTLVKELQAGGINYYDLGCSLGAGMMAISKGVDKKTRSQIIGIDNSAHMLKQAKQRLEAVNGFEFELREQNIQDTNIENASMVLMNFTLQFIPLEERDKMIQTIFDGLAKGGALILSEKIKFKDLATNQCLIDIHHQYKADQGYSQLEIARKRDAIENVLIPETLDTHIERLQSSGFSIITPWVQNLQFISILAVK